MVLQRILLDEPSKYSWKSFCEPMGVHDNQVESPWLKKTAAKEQAEKKLKMELQKVRRKKLEGSLEIN